MITPVLNGWFNTELINIQKVRAVIERFQPQHVNIFSFAIWNEQEARGFHEAVRPMLELALGVKIGLVPTVDHHIIPVCCAQMNISRDTVDFSEMSNFWGKQGAFRLFMRDHASRLFDFHSTALTAMLLDDVVHDETIEWPDKQTKLIISNIDQLHV